MIGEYRPYIPQNVGEVQDKLGAMMLSSPHFTDDEFPEMNIDTTFFALLEGFKNIRCTLGEERYDKLLDMASAMRLHFEADEVPEGNTIAYDMQELIKEAWRARRKGRAANDQV